MALVIIFYTYCIYSPSHWLNDWLNHGKACFITDWTETELTSFLLTFTPISLIPGQLLYMHSVFLSTLTTDQPLMGGGKVWLNKTNESLLDCNVRSLVLPFTPVSSHTSHLSPERFIFSPETLRDDLIFVRLHSSPVTFHIFLCSPITHLTATLCTPPLTLSSSFRSRLPLLSLV